MNGKVTAISITDTLDNIIVFLNDNIDPNQMQYIQGRPYNTKWSLTLNGEVIKEYYAYSFSKGMHNGMQYLSAIRNENNEITKYNTMVTQYRFNSFISSQSSNDGIINVAPLHRIDYSNGFNY